MKNAATNVGIKPIISLPKFTESTVSFEEFSKQRLAPTFRVGKPLIERLERFDNKACDSHCCEAVLTAGVANRSKIPFVETLHNEASKCFTVLGFNELSVGADRYRGGESRFVF